jgi:signal transduction histidine kinase
MHPQTIRVIDYWLGVPLCSQGECIGVVGIFSYGHRFRIGEPERQVLDFVSEHVAAGLEHIRTQEKLRHQERMAAMGELVAGVAHEIRNPLFSLSALLDALEPTLEGRVETDTEYLGHMHVQIARLGTLVQDLLDYGRPQQPDLVPLALSELLEESLALSRAHATEAGVELELELDARDVRVDVDRKRLTQVFHNLIENALAFAPRGSSVKVSATPRSGLVVTRVRDHGPGFVDEDVEHVFEPFFTRRKGGTGLGLSIAQRLVEENHGAIVAYNAEDGGAVVEVSLPATGPHGGAPAAPSARS